MAESTSIELRTTSDRSEPTSRSASFTVALIVVVPSCDRAASRASSSMSTSRLVMYLVRAPGVFVHPFRLIPYTHSGVFVHPVEEAA